MTTNQTPSVYLTHYRTTCPCITPGDRLSFPGQMPTCGDCYDEAANARCPVHQLPRTADTWTARCTCPSTAHGIEEAD